MKFDQGHRSDDVIDRRGRSGGGGGSRAGLFALVPLLVRSPLGIGGTLVVVALVVGVGYFRDRFTGDRAADDRPTTGEAANDPHAAFVATVLDDAQDTWTKLFAERGETYERAKLVLFTGRTGTACGAGDAAVGPFYCPADRRAYLDLGFFKELSGRLGAKGDFAEAYVIAHEIGHHVQNLRGTSDKVHRAPKSQQLGPTGLSVRLELQADCFAGVWASSTKQRDLLEAGDIDEAMNAAKAIGDDALQEGAGRTVRPESFSHGSSAQRTTWFRRGSERKAGQSPFEICDTFAVPQP